MNYLEKKTTFFTIASKAIKYLGKFNQVSEVAVHLKVLTKDIEMERSPIFMNWKS